MKQTIIEIVPIENGAHRNQTIFGEYGTIPEGYAVVPDDIVIPETFPFVNITVENGIVTSMEANQEAYDAVMAEIRAQEEAQAAAEAEPTETEQLRADVDYIAIMTGVEL